MKKLTAALVAIALAAPAALAATPSHFIKASPNPAKPGQRIRLYGSAAGGCVSGDTVTIYSRAFKGVTSHDFGGIPAVYAKTGRHDKFSRRLKLSKQLKAGRYHIGARCGGGNLGHTSLKVTK